MKIVIKVGYLFIISSMVLLFSLEYENYKNTRQTVEIYEFREQIARIRNNIDTIKQFDLNAEKEELKSIVNFCHRSTKDFKLLKYKDTDILAFKDLYNIVNSYSGGGCVIQSDNIKIKEIYANVKDENVVLFDYIYLGNKKDLKEIFKIALNNEEKMTDAFIKSYLILLNGEVNNEEN